MSMPSSQVRCHGCEYQGVMQHRPVTLRCTLPDGATVDSHRTFRWCNGCAGIRDVEQEVDVHAIRRELEKRSPRSQTLGGFFKSAIDSALGDGPDEIQAERQQLAKLLRLAELRLSPPRCLACSGTAVASLGFGE